WPQSCLVAEAKFFRNVAGKFPAGSFHLKCLHVCSHILKGTSISSYYIKTIVMHLLVVGGTSHWHRKNFVHLLECIIRCLRWCLVNKHLEHFLIGNTDAPKDIILPSEFQDTEPINLLEHLEKNQAAHAKALQEFNLLQDQL
ncbi:IPIL1 protein, partial [Upupa epops]|nr:IPIL1 protein [Upupa epops]